jgi:phospholipid-binding lipoprotein MlaA
MPRSGERNAMVKRINRLLLALIMAVALVGAGVFVPSVKAQPPQPLEEVVVTDTKLKLETETEDYDPWEPFNEKMFNFNYKLDRYVIKPLATVYNEIVLDGEKQAIANLFDNVRVPKRFVNSLLQGKFKGAAREIARFVINTTLGVGGMADVAKYQFHLEKSDEDTGQTFGYYGAGPGAYLVLPFLPPMDVRDGIGYVFDLALDPLSYVLPVGPSVGRYTEDMVNYRAQNLDTFQSVEESTLDLYSAVRNGYLTKRKQQIAE